MIADAAQALGSTPPKIGKIPMSLLALSSPFSATMRELFNQRYLWTAPSELRAGRLQTELGLSPTFWSNVLSEWAKEHAHQFVSLGH